MSLTCHCPHSPRQHNGPPGLERHLEVVTEVAKSFEVGPFALQIKQLSGRMSNKSTDVTYRSTYPATDLIYYLCNLLLQNVELLRGSWCTSSTVLGGYWIASKQLGMLWPRTYSEDVLSSPPSQHRCNQVSCSVVIRLRARQ